MLSHSRRQRIGIKFPFITTRFRNTEGNVNSADEGGYTPLVHIRGSDIQGLASFLGCGGWASLSGFGLDGCLLSRDG